MGQTRFPSLYQINTRVWLQELSQRLGRPASFDTIPDQDLDEIARFGCDWVWFLGVWQTGAAGRQISQSQPSWRREYQQILPDLKEDDIAGSPFAIVRYSVHVDFGGDEALARLRERLRRRGLKLLLDFVPNHMALDHPWVQEHPEFFIQATEAELAREPHNFCRATGPAGPLVLAHGRDPYFPGWPDTLQLNYRHAGLREAMIGELRKLATMCDGLRCDMAMLVLPEVFTRTWGNASLPRNGQPPVDAPFWPEATARTRAQHPDFLFMAEVYWDLEWALQQQGFDYTYDKRLYDRLHARDAGAVRGHLCAEADFQRKSVRFLENHDEPRAAGAFCRNVHLAAATVTFLVPGLRFFHEGQFEGRKVRVSVHLGRRPVEPVDPVIADYYKRLLDCLKRAELRDGRWQLLSCRAAWEGNPTWERFITSAWEGTDGKRLLVTVNYGPTRGQCLVQLPLANLRGKKCLLQDLMGTASYAWNGDDLASSGLYLDMPEWGYHVFELKLL